MNISQERILIVGCGSIGSWVAYCLVSLGFDQDITVVDSDSVSPHNVGGQFIGKYVGDSKVKGFTDAIESTVKPLRFTGIKTICSRIEDSWQNINPPTLIISAVDSIETRRFLANRVQDAPIHLVDFRLSATKGTIIYAPPMPISDYIESLNASFLSDGCGIHSFLPVTWATIGIGLSHLIHGPTLKRIDVSPNVARTFIPA